MTTLIGDGIDIEQEQHELKDEYYDEVTPIMGESRSMPKLNASQGSFSFLRRAEDSLASMGSLLGNVAFHRNQKNHPPSLRSQQRYQCNVLLGILLLFTSLSLTATVLAVTYVTMIQPAQKRAQLNAKIRAQAAYDAQLVQKCANVSWQTACAALLEGGSAGARRRRRRRLWSEQGEDPPEFDDDEGDDSYVDIQEVEDSLERQFLYSDDPTVAYDANCIREYRLNMMWNITFPYRSNQLLTAGGHQTMALFIQHGALRDAADYFCSFMHLMRQQTYRKFSDIIIIAPHFQYRRDDFLHPRDAFWNSSKPWGDWRVGAESDPLCCGNSGRTVSSFNVLDAMMGILTNRQLYPNMDKISFLGHSAGGQMVQRYAVMSALAALWDLGSDLTIRFVIANPSSYTYLDDRRLEYNCGTCQCGRRNCTCDQDCTTTNSVRHQWSVPTHHGVGTSFPCYSWNYDRWPYGLGSFSSSDFQYYIPYALRDGLAGPERALRIYRMLDVVYLIGQNDTCNDGLPHCDSSCWKRESWLPGESQCYRNQMDSRCPAMLQGWCRRERAYNYMNYLQHLYSQPTHTLYEIEGVGHDATAMFGSDIGMKVLFGP